MCARLHTSAEGEWVCDVHASEVHMGISRPGGAIIISRRGPSVWTLALTGIADDSDSGDIGRDLGETIDCVPQLLQE
jgi:hypothetical protein